MAGARGAERVRLPRGGEFQALWLGEAISVVGDQLAKVAVAMSVFDRTGSAAWTGAAYAATFLAPLVAGPPLAGLADRFARKPLMVTCLLLQMLCVSVIAIPWLPLGGVVAGVILVAAFQVPYKGAQGATVRVLLAGRPDGNDLTKAGRARLTLVRELGQIAGLGGAAAVVLAIGSGAALAVDAVTFLLAAILTQTGLRARPAPMRQGGELRHRPMAELRRQLRADPRLRRMFLLLALIGLTAAPDAVMVPLVADIGAPEWVVGPLLAADAVGVALTAAWLERQSDGKATRLIVPLAVLSMAPLATVAILPAHPAVLAILLVISGIGGAYIIPAIGEATQRVDDSIAGTTGGLISTVLRASQGIGALAAGALAQGFSPITAVAITGGVGMVLTGAFGIHWSRYPSQRRAG
ncbi:MFS transporter [Amycolatopsis sp. lyj-112]|uniref:MFS transporter n=1 Tax=Amycolatopsis sp. lyj-112 TaxID=2789288 RepID=UPI00397E74C6